MGRTPFAPDLETIAETVPFPRGGPIPSSTVPFVFL